MCVYYCPHMKFRYSQIADPDTAVNPERFEEKAAKWRAAGGETTDKWQEQYPNQWKPGPGICLVPKNAHFMEPKPAGGDDVVTVLNPMGGQD